MTKAEAEAVHKMLTDAHPEAWQEPGTLGTWVPALSNVDPAIALEVASQLTKAEKMPNLGQFLAHVRGAERQRDLRTGPKVKRFCATCDGTGWYEVEQLGSSMAVIPCPKCDGSGEGSDLPPAPLSDDEQKANMVKLRAAMQGMGE